MSPRNSESTRVPPSSALEQSDGLREIYDQWYEAFWGAEQMGDRLIRDLRLIRLLASLSLPAQVVDLGCSFGRIANGLAADGHRVLGIDSSMPLLASARQHAKAIGVKVDYLAIDLRDVAFLSRFDCALFWATSFGHLSERDNLDVLVRVHASLKPRGRLLVETRHWDSMRRDFQPTTVRQSGTDLLIERHSYHPETGVQWTDQTLVINGLHVRRSYGIRRYTFPELRALCLRIGFSAVSGFDQCGEPLHSDSDRCVLVATK